MAEAISKSANQEEENKSKGKKKLSKEGLKRSRQLLSYLYPYRSPFIISLILLTISSSVFLVFPWAAGELIAIAEGRSWFSFGNIGLLIFSLLIVQAIVSYVRTLLITYVSEKAMADIRKDLYKKIITQPIFFFEQRRVGELSSRASADVTMLQDAVSITLAELIRQLIILVGGMAYILYIAPGLTLIMLGTFPVVIVIAMVFGRYIRRLSKERQDELAQTNTILEETLMAVSVVKSFTNELYENLRYGRAIDRVVNISLRFARIRGLFIAFIISALFGAIFFILWIGATMIEPDAVTQGFHTEDFMRFITITAFLGGSLFSLGSFYEQMLRAVGASERVMEILEMPSELDLNNSKNEEALNLEGHIHFRNIHFNYPSRPEIAVLKGIDFEVKPGQKVALVGASGAGKSTIVQLLLRYYSPLEGEIIIDNEDIGQYPLQALRKHIAVVPQDVIMFGGSIRENIAYGKQAASEEEIIAAAEQANAWSFISEFPEGLDTLVGERGIKLSGGQRQRIAIARAILKNPTILLLDEATSALDAESERLVQEALNRLMQGRTSIIIAHRLATVREVDTIYVLEGGKIVEQGQHEELMRNPAGLYNQLAKLQFEHS